MSSWRDLTPWLQLNAMVLIEVRLTPPVKVTREKALADIDYDACGSLRLRKARLDPNACGRAYHAKERA